MKEYDLAFSLGSSCGTSMALRACGLQYASLPLDWLAIHDIETGVRLIETEFKDWFRREDLELRNVVHSVGFLTRFYLNRRTNIGYAHEFNDFEPFEKTYPRIAATYDRRVARFLEDLEKANRILAVWIDLPTHGSAGEETYRNALIRLRRRYPGKVVDLLVFFEAPDCKEPQVCLDAEGLTLVALDYRKFIAGKIAHFVDETIFAQYLKPHVSVPDTRTDEERRQHRDLGRTIHSLRWGADKSRFRRWVNKQAYKLFRQLEHILIRKRLIHGDVSYWFWDDTRREAEGGTK